MIQKQLRCNANSVAHSSDPKREPNRVGFRSAKKWLVVLVSLLCGAPTAGDIGSCGQKAVSLDVTKFTEEKELIDCARCTECGLDTAACKKACAHKVAVVPFPDECFPLVHDGEVCLDELFVASCTDYANYVAAESPSIPTECDFCPPRGVGGAGGGTSSTTTVTGSSATGVGGASFK